MTEECKVVYTPPDDIIIEKQNEAGEKYYDINKDVVEKEMRKILNIISQSIFSFFSEKNILIANYHLTDLQTAFEDAIKYSSLRACATCKAPYNGHYIDVTIGRVTYTFCSKRCMRQGLVNLASKLV
jgi:hypothetical protein